MLFFPLIHVKMPTTVGILTFMSGENFMLNWVEHEKSFITSGPDLKKSITFREHAKIFKGAVKFYYLYQFGEAEANFDKGEHGKWLHGASEILAIFSRCKGALTPIPKYTHTYNSQSHSHPSPQPPHKGGPNLSIEQNRPRTYFKNKKFISCHGTRQFAIQSLPSVEYMYGWLAILSRFQQYFSHIRTMRDW